MNKGKSHNTHHISKAKFVWVKMYSSRTLHVALYIMLCASRRQTPKCYKNAGAIYRGIKRHVEIIPTPTSCSSIGNAHATQACIEHATKQRCRSGYPVASHTATCCSVPRSPCQSMASAYPVSRSTSCRQTGCCSWGCPHSSDAELSSC
jgi:hypothetical protein